MFFLSLNVFIEWLNTACHGCPIVTITFFLISYLINPVRIRRLPTPPNMQVSSSYVLSNICVGWLGGRKYRCFALMLFGKVFRSWMISGHYSLILTFLITTLNCYRRAIVMTSMQTLPSFNLALELQDRYLQFYVSQLLFSTCFAAALHFLASENYAQEIPVANPPVQVHHPRLGCFLWSINRHEDLREICVFKLCAFTFWFLASFL